MHSVTDLNRVYNIITWSKLTSLVIFYVIEYVNKLELGPLIMWHLNSDPPSSRSLYQHFGNIYTKNKTKKNILYLFGNSVICDHIEQATYFTFWLRQCKDIAFKYLQSLLT